MTKEFITQYGELAQASQDLAMFEGGKEVLGKFRNHHTYDALKFLVNPLDTKLFKKLGTEAYTF